MVLNGYKLLPSLLIRSTFAPIGGWRRFVDRLMLGRIKQTDESDPLKKDWKSNSLGPGIEGAYPAGLVNAAVGGQFE